jgi:hypothetical protein
MSSTEWETIEVPRGAYISWGSKPGQHVTGKVLDYSPTDGTDANDKPCPQLSVQLTEEASSINREGERTRIAAGELVVLNASQVGLKRAVKAADPAPGDLIKITLVNLVKVTKGTVKEFDVKIARGAGGTTKRQPVATPAESESFEEEPPF